MRSIDSRYPLKPAALVGAAVEGGLIALNLILGDSAIEYAPLLNTLQFPGAPLVENLFRHQWIRHLAGLAPEHLVVVAAVVSVMLIQSAIFGAITLLLIYAYRTWNAAVGDAGNP